MKPNQCQYPGCPQETVKDLGWCRSHYPGNPTDLNQDSQDELRDKVARFYNSAWIEGSNYKENNPDNSPIPSEREVKKTEQLLSFINAHTQKAVTEARIDELENLDDAGGEYELITYVSGEQTYVADRIATLTKQNERNQ